MPGWNRFSTDKLMEAMGVDEIDYPGGKTSEA